MALKPSTLSGNVHGITKISGGIEMKFFLSHYYHHCHHRKRALDTSPHGVHLPGATKPNRGNMPLNGRNRTRCFPSAAFLEIEKTAQIRMCRACGMKLRCIFFSSSFSAGFFFSLFLFLHAGRVRFQIIETRRDASGYKKSLCPFDEKVASSMTYVCFRDLLGFS